MTAIRTLVSLFCLFALTPSAALAVTVDQILALTKAGVSDAVIVALIERDRTVFTLDPAQLVELQQAGVTEAVTVTMLRTGEPQADTAAPPAVAAPQLPDVVVYAVPVPVRPRRNPVVATPVVPTPQPASSARGIFFSRPATGIFFAPPPAADCPPPAGRPHRP